MTSKPISLPMSLSEGIPLRALQEPVGQLDMEHALAHSAEGVRDCLRDILNKKQTVEQTVDEILRLFTESEVPWEPTNLDPQDERLKRQSARRYIINQLFSHTNSSFQRLPFKGLGTLTITDSGFESGSRSGEQHGVILPLPRNEARQPPTELSRNVLAGIGDSVAKFDLITRMSDPELLGHVSAVDSTTSSSQTQLQDDDDISIQSEDSEQSGLPHDLLGGSFHVMTEHLVGFFRRLVDVRMGFRQHPNNSSGPGPSTGGGKAAASDGRADTSRGDRQKHRLKNNKGEDEISDDENEDENPEKKRPKVEEPRIACPYAKKYPLDFLSSRTCLGPGFGTIGRMKEHLKRRHYKEHVCDRCGEQFSSASLLREHRRAATPCLVLEIVAKKGMMSLAQYEEIFARKRQGGTDAQKWRDIFLVLFPGTEEAAIPSPYFDIAEASSRLGQLGFDFQAYEDYLRGHLPARILFRLNHEFVFLQEKLKQHLIEVVQEESLEMLRSYLQPRGVQMATAGIDLSLPSHGPRLTLDDHLLQNLNPFAESPPLYGLPDDTTALPSMYWWPFDANQDSGYGSSSTDNANETSSGGEKGKEVVAPEEIDIEDFDDRSGSPTSGMD